ncbi:MAG: hypothetical protein ACXVHQ_41790 [Solirubrobacteraceae bacterium]
MPVAYKQAIIDLAHKAFTEIKPDLSLELLTKPGPARRSRPAMVSGARPRSQTNCV